MKFFEACTCTKALVCESYSFKNCEKYKQHVHLVHHSSGISALNQLAVDQKHECKSSRRVVINIFQNIEI